MEINEKQVRAILQDQKKVYQFLYKLGEVFGNRMQIYEVLDLDKTTEVIWDIYQIPQEDMPDFDPEKKIEKGEYDFCRDGLDVVAHDYIDGNISLDAYIKKLKMWSEEFRHIYVNQIANGVKNAK
tara:strand:+ start:1872 stop:2246 length:375 start_codon:yes stop_codon:yes gene_type:complete